MNKRTSRRSRWGRMAMTLTVGLISLPSLAQVTKIQSYDPTMRQQEAFRSFGFKLDEVAFFSQDVAKSLEELAAKLEVGQDDTKLLELIIQARGQVTLVVERLREFEAALIKLPNEFPQVDTRLIPVEHADVKKVSQLLEVFKISGCTVIPDSELRVLAVSGPTESVQQVQDAVTLLDKPALTNQEPPKKNIELIAYILEGTDVAPEGDGGVAELTDVIDQLGATFPYPHWQLRDTLLLRCRDGEEAQISNMLGGFEGATQQLRIDRVSVTPAAENDGPASIRLDNFVYGADIPYSNKVEAVTPRPTQTISRRNIGFKANLDLLAGQKVVVGKANYGEGNTAVFVVVTATVVGG